MIHRQNLTVLFDSDRLHLEGDVNRIYQLLVMKWLTYMQYLQKHYTYLLSLTTRVNPINPDAKA